tara:strand:+ start:1072 stop:1320 length:249 start_codon:yes stop_codon:yes gene_type:complete
MVEEPKITQAERYFVSAAVGAVSGVFLGRFIEPSNLDILGWSVLGAAAVPVRNRVYYGEKSYRGYLEGALFGGGVALGLMMS